MTDAKGRKRIRHNLSCRGRSFNVANQEVNDCVYVSDGFIVNNALQWLKRNIRRYKFVGLEAVKIKRRICAFKDTGLASEASGKLLEDFFRLILNNPFCVENGIGITEATYIVGKSLDSYFVTYKDNLHLPIAALKQVVHSKIDIVLEEFVENAKRFAENEINSCCAAASSVRDDIESRNITSPATVFMAVSSALMFSLSVMYVIYCAIRIDWASFTYYAGKTNGLRQLIGFICEEGFGINHNSDFIIILLALAVIWLLYCLLFIRFRFIRELRNALRFNKLRTVLKSANLISGKLPAIKEKISKSRDFIAENCKTPDAIFLNAEHNVKAFGKHMVVVENENSRGTTGPFGSALPGSVKVLCFLTLAIIVFSLSAGKTALQYTFDFAIADFSYKLTNLGLKAREYYITKDSCDVYTLPDASSLITYQLSPLTKCRVVDSEHEDFYKITFFSEYGQIVGWVDKIAVTSFDPVHDVTLERAVVSSIEGSSELSGKKYYGAKNVLDGSLRTSWQEGAEGAGEGEWLLVKFDESKDIKVIGLYNGSGSSEELYFANARPIQVTFLFNLEGENVDKVSYQYEDIYEAVQYFELNKSVSADEIVITIEAVNPGSVYEDACISEIEIYNCVKLLVDAAGTE